MTEEDDIRNQRIDNIKHWITPDFTRKPHTCPNCEGTGTLSKINLYANPTAILCHSCAGTGIVWEPR